MHASAACKSSHVASYPIFLSEGQAEKCLLQASANAMSQFISRLKIYF
jgi:hypothetical protein